MDNNERDNEVFASLEEKQEQEEVKRFEEFSVRDIVFLAICSAVVVLPHHFGPSIKTAPLPSSFSCRMESTTLFRYFFTLPHPSPY